MTKTTKKVIDPVTKWVQAGFILRNARTSFADNKWIRGRYHDGDKACAVGGLQNGNKLLTTTSRAPMNGARTALKHAIKENAGSSKYDRHYSTASVASITIEAWNDAPSRRVENVLETFDLAIDYADRKANECLTKKNASLSSG